MNNGMGVKEYLQQALSLKKQLGLKKQQLSELEEMKEELCGTSAVGHIDALRDDYVKEVTRLLMLKYELGELVARVPDKDCRMILEARYVACLKWEQIADLTYYSLVHVYRLAGEGLAALEKMPDILKSARI